MTEFKPGQRVRLTVEGVVAPGGTTLLTDTGGIWGLQSKTPTYEILSDPCPPQGSILLDKDDNAWRVGVVTLYNEANCAPDVRCAEWAEWVERYGPYKVLREGPA